jgi:hypothetical protein
VKRLVRLALVGVVMTIGAYVVYLSMGDVGDICIIARDGLKTDSRLPIEELAEEPIPSSNDVANEQSVIAVLAIHA